MYKCTRAFLLSLFVFLGSFFLIPGTCCAGDVVFYEDAFLTPQQEVSIAEYTGVGAFSFRGIFSIDGEVFPQATGEVHRIDVCQKGLSVPKDPSLHVEITYGKPFGDLAEILFHSEGRSQFVAGELKLSLTRTMLAKECPEVLSEIEGNSPPSAEKILSKLRIYTFHERNLVDLYAECSHCLHADFSFSKSGKLDSVLIQWQQILGESLPLGGSSRRAFHFPLGVASTSGGPVKGKISTSSPSGDSGESLGGCSFDKSPRWLSLLLPLVFLFKKHFSS